MYFGVTPPSVHLMIVKLAERGSIDRIPYPPARYECFCRPPICRWVLNRFGNLFILDADH